MFEEMGFIDCPFEQLHAACASSQCHQYFFDAKVITQVLKSPYHIAYGKHRKIVIPCFTGLRIYAQGADTAVGAPRFVYTNDKVFRRVEEFSFSNEAGPPFNRVTVSCSCMKYPDHIGSGSVQFSVGGISQVITR